jgi:hypothetical protein
MTPLDTLLIGAIVSLCGVVGLLFRLYAAEKDGRRKDVAEAAQLIFALMSRVKAFKREPPPKTASDWDDEPTTGIIKARFKEASALANDELNGEVERLVKDFLNGTPSSRPLPIKKGPWG